ncbi:MAG: ABC transporter permease [Prevotellaceae bacterium]|nr:ABC transporter permease [Prevotellaceae bacterium]
MLNLLKIEWLKLNQYRPFLILLGLFALSVFGINYVFHEILAVTGGTGSMLVGMPFQFPGVWNTVTYLSSFLLFIPGLLMILIISNEYSFRTHRQNIIDGVSRSQFIVTKILLAIILSVCLTVLVFIVALLFGIAEGDSAFSLQLIKYVFYFFIQSVAYISVAMVLVLLLKRSGISIGVYFLYAFILENTVTALINNKLNPVGYFFPLESADKLIPLPGIFGQINQNVPDEKYLLLTSIIWIIACLWFCKLKFEKSDL